MTITMRQQDCEGGNLWTSIVYAYILVYAFIVCIFYLCMYVKTCTLCKMLNLFLSCSLHMEELTCDFAVLPLVTVFPIASN